MEFSFGKHGTGRLPFAQKFPDCRAEQEKLTADRLRFAISDSTVDTSAVYKMKENMLQKIYNYFRGRIKYSAKLDSHSILDTN